MVWREQEVTPNVLLRVPYQVARVVQDLPVVEQNIVELFLST